MPLRTIQCMGLGRLLCLGIGIGYGAVVYAHHYFAPEYEREQRGTISGTVAEVNFINPHVQVEIEIVTEEGAREQWFANSVSPHAVSERGWEPHTITAGDLVTIEGFLGRNGAKRVWIQSIVLEAGTVIYPVGRELTADQP